MSGDGGDSDVGKTVASVLTDHPIAVGILFGSRARGDRHEHSDVDVAVAFENLEPGDEGYNDTLFGLSADLAAELETDEVDVLDLRRVSPRIAQSILKDWTLLIGDEREARRLLKRLADDTDEHRPPAERFDDILTAIEDHLA